MNKFIKTIKDIFSIEELRNRILYTFGFLLVFRLGCFILLPGVDSEQLVDSQGVFGFLNNILGGAFNRASIFALGIMPYISASIVIQLLTVAVPYFQKKQKEGESGRKKITQITRVLTIIITLAQGGTYVSAYIPAEAIMPYMVESGIFIPLSVVILTTGTMFCMWLGEKITDRGVGNGISMLIMIGIISSFPQAIIAEIGASGPLIFLIEAIALFFIVMAVVLLTQAVRRIPIQYAKQVVGGGRSQVGKSQRSYLPLKVNSANVMPIIFAQSLMFAPALIAGAFSERSDFAIYIQSVFSDFTSWEYNLTFAILIIVFTFFYTAITINPNQMKDDLKRSGAFIPGIKPGQPTADYISIILDRITLPGALYLALVAILPAFASMAGVQQSFAQFYGGTSLIIMVGVILDTLQQINSYLLMRQYDGLMKSGKLRDRSQVVA
ncbi:MAG: preprotein translocase subunit SecY [Bacteroidia bacterium]|jgi:preprotein translocase subunit SecY